MDLKDIHFDEKKAKENAEKMLEVIEKDPQVEHPEWANTVTRLAESMIAISIAISIGDIVLSQFAKSLKEGEKNNKKAYKHPPLTVKGSKMNMRKK